MRTFLKNTFDVRQERFWRILIGLGVVFRLWNVMFYRNPMSLIFSDASRHWDNAKHFMTPGPMGASNPYLYQLFLWLAQLATKENKTGMGLVAAALSVLYPLCWYLLARRVMRRRINALRYATVISFLPTHVSQYSFFMNETLLFPLLGLAFLATVRAGRERKWGFFLLAAVLWTMCAMTRSVVLPIGGLAMLWAWWRLPWRPMKALTSVAALAIVLVGFGVAAKRAYPLLHRYTPFGDNENVSIYFWSGNQGYQVNYLRRGTYIYASPSLYISPFEPFYEFKSMRKGIYSYSIDSDKKGADVKETLAKVRKAAFAGPVVKWKIWRLLYENVLFISFSHSWPDSSKGNPPGVICLWERWIWFPIMLTTFYRSFRYMRRRGRALIPALAMLFTLSLYAASFATIMEGRYRKPLEPLLLLTMFWLAEAKRPAPAWKEPAARVRVR